MAKTRKNHRRRNKRHCKTTRGAGASSLRKTRRIVYLNYLLGLTKDPEKIKVINREIENLTSQLEMEDINKLAKKNTYFFKKQEEKENKNKLKLFEYTQREQASKDLKEMIDNKCITEDGSQAVNTISNYCNKKNFFTRNLFSKCRLLNKYTNMVKEMKNRGDHLKYCESDQKTFADEKPSAKESERSKHMIEDYFADNKKYQTLNGEIDPELQETSLPFSNQLDLDNLDNNTRQSDENLQELSVSEELNNDSNKEKTGGLRRRHLRRSSRRTKRRHSRKH
jgi:hypothetical protein